MIVEMKKAWARLPTWGKFVAAGVVLLLIIGAASGGSGKSDKTESASHTTASSAPTTTAEPAPTPKPKPLTLTGRLRKDVIDINLDGEGKVRAEIERKVGRRYNVLIYHELADNVSGGLVQRGAELDATKILQNLYTGPDSKRLQDVTVLSTGKLIDGLGNESTGIAFSVTLPGSLGHRINWANVDQIDLRKLWQTNVDRIK